MFSVALIGPDGAGKTTIARMLEQRSPLPLKYIYMGVNIAASNFALPTSRFFEYLRARQNENHDLAAVEGQTPRIRGNGKRSAGKVLWAAGKLAHQLADEWYRQLYSWAYQWIGHIALYDRHYLFDFSLGGVDVEQEGFDTRLHRWFLTYLYPRPDLVIYLDAPAEVLFARKGEKGIEDLDRRRKSFLELMGQSPNCFVVDGTQPLSKVYSDVASHIIEFYKMQLRNVIPPGRKKPDSLPPAQPESDQISESTR